MTDTITALRLAADAHGGDGHEATAGTLERQAAEMVRLREALAFYFDLGQVARAALEAKS